MKIGKVIVGYVFISHVLWRLFRVSIGQIYSINYLSKQLVMLGYIIWLLILICLILSWRNEKKYGPNVDADFNKYPLLFIIFLIVFGVGVVDVVCIIISFCQIILIPFFHSLAKLDAVVIVALLTGIVTFLTQAFVKYTEYKTRRYEYLCQKREKAYEGLIEIVYNVNSNHYTDNQEMINDFRNFSKSLTLWGSKRVVKKWNEFREISQKPNQGNQILYILEELMDEMRKDMGVKKVGKNNLLSFFINDLKNGK